MCCLLRIRRLRGALLLFSSAAILSACASIQTGSHYDETANFAAYDTFGWVSERPYVHVDADAAISALTQAKLESAIREELTKAGYTYTDSPAPDMLVAYTVGTRDKIRQEAYPIDYPGYWGWHIHGSYFYVREVRQHSYTQGTLGVDIFDGTTKKPIWHGWAEKTISSSDRKDPTATIKAGTAKLFSAFPQ